LHRRRGAYARPACARFDLRILTRRIDDDAVAYNQAYSAAINGQILLNILRAYNRHPRAAKFGAADTLTLPTAQSALTSPPCAARFSASMTGAAFFSASTSNGSNFR
jgi:hypothetical protein